ncbi:MAG: class I SAM-dependent methyltransferase [Pseudomonadales bacterium]|jgi:SAM-dependent methyltransferase|nr:class I SAM-dependent methyltransferase [Pseudomonadales bacterium]
MDISTIKKLTELNNQFYKQIATDFSDSRRYSWRGWEQSWAEIENLLPNNPKILDVAAGNLRYKKFLEKKLDNFSYLAIDSCEPLMLLGKPEEKQYRTIDAIVELVENSSVDTLSKKLDGQTFDLVVCFGFMHHIPSRELRKLFIENLINLLEPSGILVITFWQFMRNERLKNRVVDPQILEIGDLEENDYIVDWQWGQKAYRYCHHADDNEIGELMDQFKNLKLLAEFHADGENNNNKYLILQKQV